MKKPCASSPEVSARMSVAKTSGTQPEMAIRRLLFKAGLRYRVQYRVSGLARRSIDIAFPRVRLAIFVDGCFWHGCERHRSVPTSNAEWWMAKLTENRLRDNDTGKRLSNFGWSVLRFWEHDNPQLVASKILRVVQRLSSRVPENAVQRMRS